MNSNWTRQRNALCVVVAKSNWSFQVQNEKKNANDNLWSFQVHSQTCTWIFWKSKENIFEFSHTPTKNKSSSAISGLRCEEEGSWPPREECTCNCKVPLLKAITTSNISHLPKTRPRVTVTLTRFASTKITLSMWFNLNYEYNSIFSTRHVLSLSLSLSNMKNKMKIFTK